MPRERGVGGRGCQRACVEERTGRVEQSVLGKQCGKEEGGRQQGGRKYTPDFGACVLRRGKAHVCGREIGGAEAAELGNPEEKDQREECCKVLKGVNRVGLRSACKPQGVKPQSWAGGLGGRNRRQGLNGLPMRTGRADREGREHEQMGPRRYTNAGGAGAGR